MSIDGASIGVKAMVVCPSGDLMTHAVSVMLPTTENPRGFHRLIGGSVEFGETHREAVTREVFEELGATIDDLTYVDVVENIFRVNGVLGHEVVFVYTGRLDPEPVRNGAMLREVDGSVLEVVWRPFDDTNEPLPLFPAGLANLALLAARGQRSG